MRPNTDPLEALMRRVEKADDGCWNRSGALCHGYPVVKIRGRQWRAARLSYELHTGPIPEGLTVDHLCRNTRCVNPEHMELVTQGENSRRMQAAREAERTHCPNGHAIADFAYFYKGCRHCRACRHERQMRWREANPERWRDIKNASARRVYAARKAA